MAIQRKVGGTSSTVPPTLKNKYLQDQTEGLLLVADIISAMPHGRSKTYYKVDAIMDEKLLSLSGNLNLNNELDLYSKLVLLSDRLMIPEKYKLLGNRAVIGLGGKFSSGKSLFINSLLKRDELPVEQAPSTSVPTYIIGGEKDKVYAHTIKGAKVPLDTQAVKAISHGFQRVYGLGLAQYISFVSICVSDFWNDIALLDTPGYNKADSSVLQAYSDQERAYTQLRSIDYLIWLLDVENGTLSEDDIGFIRRLKLKTKVLIVINKCDLSTKSNCEDVAQQVRWAAEGAGIQVFDVVMYSSVNPELMNGLEQINTFIKYAQLHESKVEDIQSQVRDITIQINTAFKEKLKKLETSRNKIGAAIFKSNSLFEMKSLVSMYGSINSEKTATAANQAEFQKTEEQLFRLISKLY